MGDAPTDPRLYEKYAADPAVYAEVMSFADYLGFDLHGYPDLYWIAEQVRDRACHSCSAFPRFLATFSALTLADFPFR